jgi:hypothetical protein
MPPKRPRAPLTREDVLKRALERRDRARQRVIVRRANRQGARARDALVDRAIEAVQAGGSAAAREAARRARDAFNMALEQGRQHGPGLAMGALRGVMAAPGMAVGAVNAGLGGVVAGVQAADRVFDSAAAGAARAAGAAGRFVAGEVRAAREGVAHLQQGVHGIINSPGGVALDAMMKAALMPFDAAGLVIDRAVIPFGRQLVQAGMDGIADAERERAVLNRQLEADRAAAEGRADEVQVEASAQNQAAAGLGAYAQARALMLSFMGAAQPAPPLPPAPAPPGPPPPPPSSGQGPLPPAA